MTPSETKMAKQAVSMISSTEKNLRKKEHRRRQVQGIHCAPKMRCNDCQFYFKLKKKERRPMTKGGTSQKSQRFVSTFSPLSLVPIMFVVDLKSGKQRTMNCVHFVMPYICARTCYSRQIVMENGNGNNENHDAFAHISTHCMMTIDRWRPKPTA